MSSKQVIVLKKFQSLRTGKYCSQSSHASVGALLSIGEVKDNNLVIPLSDPFVREWVTGSFAKITLQVDTDQELVDIYVAAQKAGLPTALIRDAGRTEFNGVATLTAVGIGPADPVLIDKITGHLKLF
jgi:PTH2 family peptidyl-tRNA hydrolase